MIAGLRTDHARMTRQFHTLGSERAVAPGGACPCSVTMLTALPSDKFKQLRSESEIYITCKLMVISRDNSKVISFVKCNAPREHSVRKKTGRRQGRDAEALPLF